jgi:hypothetical protein
MYYPAISSFFKFNKALATFEKKHRVKLGERVIVIAIAISRINDEGGLVTTKAIRKELGKVAISTSDSRSFYRNLHLLETEGYIKSFAATRTTQLRAGYYGKLYKVQPALLALLQNLEMQVRKTKIR